MTLTTSAAVGTQAAAAPARAERQFAQRTIGFLVLIVIELLGFSFWLDTDTLQGGAALSTLLAQSGPGVIQGAVAFLIVAVVFGESRLRAFQAAVAPRLETAAVRWPFLAAHLALMLAFATMSWALFSIRVDDTALNGLTAAWLLAGTGTVVLAALAFMPAVCWLELFRATRDVIAWALAVSAGMYAFGQLALSFWEPSSLATMRVALALLDPFGLGIEADPVTRIIGNADFRVEIAASCSGYEGVGLILVFTSTWLWFHRREWRFPAALLLIPIGVTAIWLVNCVRVAALVLIGCLGAPDVAVGGFHSQAGWLAFNAIALGICVAARRIPLLIRAGANERAATPAASNATAAYLLPFLTILAASMIAQLGSSGFEWLYPLRVLGAGGALWYFRKTYELTWRRWGGSSVLDGADPPYAGPPYVAIGVGTIAFIAWMAIELLNPLPEADMPDPLSRAPDSLRGAWIAFRVLGGVIAVPIAEELAFRGYLLRRLVSPIFQTVDRASVSWAPIVLSSVAFGLLHGERWLAGAVAGVLYALIWRRCGSLVDAIAAHATTNALLAVWVLNNGAWQFW